MTDIIEENKLDLLTSLNIHNHRAFVQLDRIEKRLSSHSDSRDLWIACKELQISLSIVQKILGSLNKGE